MSLDDESSTREDSRRRLMFTAGGFAATAALLAVVLGLGGWAYNYRRYSLHDERLRRLVARHPPMELAQKGVLAEPDAQELKASFSESDVRAWLPTASPEVVAALLAKRRRWAGATAFRVGDMLYFLYADADGLLQDYAVFPRGPQSHAVP